MRLVIHTDGASRGNPGEAGIGILIMNESGQVVDKISEYIGRVTNNVAEYTALVRALERARDLGATRVRVYADSELMVKQLNGEYKVKNEGLQPLFNRALSQVRKFEEFQIEHITRDRNKEADRLANEGIDHR